MEPDQARRDEETATQRRARLLGIAYIDTSQLVDRPLFPDILPVQQLQQYRVVPIQADKSNIVFGITTTTSQITMNLLRQQFTDQRITYAIISDTGYREYMRLYNPPKKIEYQDITINREVNQDVLSSISATLEQVRPDDILAYLVKQAYLLKASDIHLENQKNDVRIRFRVDGVLHPIAMLTREKYHHLLGAIASAANISTDATDAQGGHINRTYQLATGESVTVNLRVETVPAAFGQDAVMRLFNLQMELLDLDKLGLDSRQRAIVDDIIKHPTGMVLVVGPTGSGKTTTMYSLVNTLNSDEKKIITLEDPVEYYLDGVVQIPVAGDQDATSFAERLRAVLRLDPDIVMVGEIRDQDTAKTALQAALTGHLVLSTFHGSSAAAALTRMVDYVGVNPLFASAIHLIMAQRLVRRLDNATKKPYQPDEQLKAAIQRVLNTLPQGIERPDITNLTLYSPGSSPENPFGFTGQFAIREQLLMTAGVRELLRLPPEQITSDQIQQRAIADGMLTMEQDGVLKAIAGETSIEEIYRVVA